MRLSEFDAHRDGGDGGDGVDGEEEGGASGQGNGALPSSKGKGKRKGEWGRYLNPFATQGRNIRRIVYTL